MWNGFSPRGPRRRSGPEGVWLRPSEYGDGTPYPITRALIEEGRNHLLLGSMIEVGCPVRILQGAQDPDVPWQHAFALAHRLPAEDVVLTMIQDGDHRLSRPQDIARIIAPRCAEIGLVLAAQGENAMDTEQPLLRAFCDAVEQRNGKAFAELFTRGRRLSRRVSMARSRAARKSPR